MNVQKKLQELVTIYGNNCIYCDQVAANTIDHIIPQSSGWGRSNFQNLLPACKPCNSKKRDSDIFAYASSDRIELINGIRISHSMLALMELTEQYLAWKDQNMNDSFFSIKLIKTGKMDGNQDNSLYNKLRTLIGLYFVMIDNHQLDRAKEILDTIFLSNDYDELYKKYVAGNLEGINNHIRNKNRSDTVDMLKKVYDDYTNNKTTSISNPMVSVNSNNSLELIVNKYRDLVEPSENVDDGSLTYLNNTIADIAQLNDAVKKLRNLEKERIAIDNQILIYQQIKTKIDEEYQQVINNLENISGNDLINSIISRLKFI